jgi:hypothetical protein
MCSTAAYWWEKSEITKFNTDAKIYFLYVQGLGLSLFCEISSLDLIFDLDAKIPRILPYACYSSLFNVGRTLFNVKEARLALMPTSLSRLKLGCRTLVKIGLCFDARPQGLGILSRPRQAHDR